MSDLTAANVVEGRLGEWRTGWTVGLVTGVFLSVAASITVQSFAVAWWVSVQWETNTK